MAQAKAASQQRPATVGNDEYFSRRDLHPRTGDWAAFTGRTSPSDVSPRSDYHDDVMNTFRPHPSTESQDVPTEADVELEGVTADGGLALNVGFDSRRQANAEAAQHHPHAEKVATVAASFYV